MAASPVVFLSMAEEESIRTHVKEHARKMCDPQIKEFVECTRTGTISVIWRCQKLSKQMNECLNQFTTDAEFDRLRNEKLKEKREIIEKGKKKGWFQ